MHLNALQHSRTKSTGMITLAKSLNAMAAKEASQKYLNRRSFIIKLLATVLGDDFLRIFKLSRIPCYERHPRSLSSCQFRDFQANPTGATCDDHVPPSDWNSDRFERSSEIRHERYEGHGEPADHEQWHAPCRPRHCAPRMRSYICAFHGKNITQAPDLK